MITFRKDLTIPAETLEDLVIQSGMLDCIDESAGYARVDLSRLDFDQLIAKVGADRASLAYLGSLERDKLAQ